MGQTQTAEGVLKESKVDLKTKVCIVTGSSAGIGQETARVLALGGARVILACRGKDKADKAAEEIRKAIGSTSGSVEFLEFDLMDLDNVRTFAKNFLALNIPLHYLILNAGVMNTPYRKTKQGYESQFGTNHLGHFLLTNLLLPKLKESVPSRVVVLSSAAHKNGQIFWDSNFLQDGKDYNGWTSYGQSKLCNILFTMELDRRLKEEAKDSKERVVAVCLHPGVIKTDLGRESTFVSVGLTVASPFLKNIPQGAATTLFCCLSPNIEGGKYYSDCALAEVKPHKSVLPLDKAAVRLWEVSEKLVNTPTTTTTTTTTTTIDSTPKIVITEVKKDEEQKQDTERLPEKQKEEIVSDVTSAIIGAGQEREKELAQQQETEQTT